MANVKDIEHRRNLEILEGVDIGKYIRGLKPCPFCGEHGDIVRDCFDSDDDLFPKLRVPVDCENCGKKWNEIYTLKELWIRSK